MTEEEAEILQRYRTLRDKTQNDLDRIDRVIEAIEAGAEQDAPAPARRRGNQKPVRKARRVSRRPLASSGRQRRSSSGRGAGHPNFAQAQKLFEQGATMAEIESATGIMVSTLRNWPAKFGWKRPE